MWKKLVTLLLVLVLIPLPGVLTQETQKIIVLTSDNLADSAMAEVVGKLLGADVVTTEWGVYDPEVTFDVLAEGPDLVIIIGGTLAVPSEYEEDFSTAGVDVMRWGGANREETSYNVLTGLERYFPSALEKASTVVFIEGRNPAAFSVVETFTKLESPDGAIVLFADMSDESFRDVALSVVDAVGAQRVEIVVLAGEKSKPVFGKESLVLNVSMTLNERGIEADVSYMTPSRKIAATAITKADSTLLNLPTYDDTTEERLEKAKKLLEKAREAYERGNYMEAYLLALTAEGYADVVKKRNLEVFRSTFQGSGKHGLEFKLMRLKWIVKALKANGRDVSDLESLIADIEHLINTGHYGEAAQRIESLKKDIQEEYARGREGGRRNAPSNPGNDHRP